MYPIAKKKYTFFNASIYNYNTVNINSNNVNIKKISFKKLYISVLFGTDVNIKNNSENILHPLFSQDYTNTYDILSSIYIFKLCYKYGVNVNNFKNSMNNLYTTPLWETFFKSKYKSKLLLKFGAFPNYKYYLNNTLLHKKIINNYNNNLKNNNILNNHIYYIKLLLKYNANPNIRNFLGFTALHSLYFNYGYLYDYSTSNNLDYYFELFLNYEKFNINTTDYNGDTLLHYACKNFHKNIISLLLKYNANPNIKNNSDETPLYSLLNCDIDNDDNYIKECVQLLLQNNASPNSRNSITGLRPIDLALQYNKSCVNLLIAYGANPIK